jgi:FkbM family methyltransferase
VLRTESPPGTIVLRKCKADIGTFGEVFLEEVYGGIVTRVRNCRSILDLGASIGLASLYFAKHFPAARIAAVEPHPENFALMQKNLKPPMDAGRGTVINAAVWRGEDQSLSGYPGSDGLFNTFAVNAGGPVGAKFVAVQAASTSTLLERAGFTEVDLLKVDIEGSEVELFRGNLEWLTHTEALAIEFHKSSRAACDFDRIMSEYGFSVCAGERHTVVAIKQKAARQAA